MMLTSIIIRPVSRACGSGVFVVGHGSKPFLLASSACVARRWFQRLTTHPDHFCSRGNPHRASVTLARRSSHDHLASPAVDGIPRALFIAASRFAAPSQILFQARHSVPIFL